MDTVGRSRATCGGVYRARLKVERPRPDRSDHLQREVDYRLLSLFVGAVELGCCQKATSPTEVLECQTGQRGTRSDCWSQGSPSPV